MKKNVILFSLFAILLFAITSCKKYPEGPSFSLRPKKIRLCQTWNLVKYVYDGTDETSSFLQNYTAYQFTINKSGSMVIYSSSYMQQNNSTHVVQVNGIWEFSDTKTNLIFNEQNTTDNTLSQPLPGGIRHDYHILKLTEKDLGLQENVDGHSNKYYFHHEK